MGDQETRLLTRAAEGETEAFQVLFEAHRDAVFRLAFRLTGALDVAEDVAQECFLGLIRQPGRFDARRGSLRQYLCGTARNLVRQRWQASGREVPLEDNSDADPGDLTLSGSSIESGEVSEAVQEAIGLLPILQREALVLFEFEELSLEEIAAVAGCDAGAVKSRLHRARARLRRLLAPCWNQVRGARPDQAQGSTVRPPNGQGAAEGTDKPRKAMVTPTKDSLSH
jgi:RNA polymerase sigma-70 factor (ECF subfamily)